ncbi:MAG: hypothetical protein KJ732_01935 [Candidatus Margulisbacteria bacterium]|nr:hypothetical protein [Candidatus Margulisiibacteriota bacterium]
MTKPRRFKLVVFIPQSHLEEVRAAICLAGAGQIGNYDNCAFISKGIGTYRPLKGATPFKGKKGRLEKTKEARLETIVLAPKLKPVIAAMKKAHPYEAVAYDVYKLEAA